jgi:hypothetical protein
VADSNIDTFRYVTVCSVAVSNIGTFLYVIVCSVAVSNIGTFLYVTVCSVAVSVRLSEDTCCLCSVHRSDEKIKETTDVH